MKMFGEEAAESGILPCLCCYSCVLNHIEAKGCQECSMIMGKFFPSGPMGKITRSVKSELKDALTELFEAMDITSIKVERNMDLDCESFVGDVVRVIDEITRSEDIVKLWHIDLDLSAKVFAVIEEVIFGDEDCEEDIDVSDTESEDEQDISSSEPGSESVSGSGEED